jgi:hypothetical protein
MIPKSNRNLGALALALSLLALGALAAPRAVLTSAAPIPAELRLLAARVQSGGSASGSRYETRTLHDPEGTGKFYMGREIAQVMGPGGIPWLDRPTREQEEQPGKVIDALELREGEVVVDLGAGSGYFSFRMAPKVGASGKVLAVEIQDQMLAAILERAAAMKIANVETVKGTETDPRLPAHGVDLVLLVDVYHELAYPFEVMTAVGSEGADQGGAQDVVGTAGQGNERRGPGARADG